MKLVTVCVCSVLAALVVLAAACQPETAAPTATPLPTATAMQTPVPTATFTATPPPTPTAMPGLTPRAPASGNEQAWTLIWADEFDVDGLPDPARWDYEAGYVRNNELQYYTRARQENARIEGGMLIIGVPG